MLAAIALPFSANLNAERKTASFSSKAEKYAFTDSNSIFVADKHGSRSKVFFKEGRSLRHHKLSSDGKTIAVQLRNPNKKIEQPPVATYFGHELVIKDIEKDSVLLDIAMDRLLDFCWSPDGRKIVFIKGIFERSLRPTFGAEGKEVYILDVTSGELKKLLDGGEEKTFWAVKWLPMDGRLYLTTTVLKEHNFFVNAFYYDFESKKLVPTRAHSANLSPDGKFCLETYGEGEQGTFSDAETGERIELIFDNKEEQKLYQSGYFSLFDWKVEDGTAFAIGINSNKWWTVDCATGRVSLLKLPAQVANASGNGFRAVGMKNGKIVWSQKKTDNRVEFIN